MATEEREWKALEKIKGIVEDLGENSYVGAAFTGTFIDAENNIKNGWRCSKARTAYLLGEKLSKAKKEIDHANKEIQELREDNERLVKQVGTIVSERDEYAKEWERCRDSLVRKAKECEEKDLEIMRLKAMLFDKIMEEKQ